MPAFTLYTANCFDNAQNTDYPNRIEVTDEAALLQAVGRDYVAAAYRDGRRANGNFLRTDCLPLDCDNDFTEEESQWLTPEKLMQLLPDVPMGIHFSRHHLLPKAGKKPRPRFHVLLWMEETADPAAWGRLKKRMNGLFPYFDEKSMDTAHFFFGTEHPQGLFREGTISLNECLDRYYPEDPFEGLPDPGDTIPEGQRNATMHRFAVQVMKRFGVTQQTRQLFREMAAKCDPPLETEELGSIWRSARTFYLEKIATQPGYVPPESYGDAGGHEEDPIPFSRFTVAPFPVEALPQDIGSFVAAVAESTQTPVDMAGTVALSLLSVCLQGKYRVQGKADWQEPVNTYALVIATPSERKSAVLHQMLKPLHDYEQQFNRRNAAAVEGSKARRRVLEKRQRAVEEQVAKGNADLAALDQISEEIANFEEEQPLKLYVDDVTPEKLVSVIAENKGQAALVSSEGGIFDTLAGIYSKNVNIDVMLKGYSGDTIRVDRIGRASESILNPALTVLLMAQPNVVSTVLSNPVFRGRGLTARFLYCMPGSQVGTRRFDSEAIPPETARAYERKMVNLLEDEAPYGPRVISLSEGAYRLLSDFAEELEPRLPGEYAEIADWAGKLVGNTLRIAALLCRADRLFSQDFWGQEANDLVVDETVMERALQLGRYYLSHALAAFDAMPVKGIQMQTTRILDMIRERKLKEFDRRKAMRFCRFFKTAEEIQPVLDFLEDYGYIFQLPVFSTRVGRPQQPKYIVNAKVLQ